MVALLVRLKLTLLRNSLRRSVWRTVGLILAIIYALGVVLAVIAGLIALRYTSLDLTADVTVLAFSGLTLGWLLMSLLVFGVDETVDPAKFALLPVRARDLMPGLLVGGLVGVPGVATVLVALGLLVTWARTPPLTLAAALASVLGVATCFLLSRAATAAFAAFLSSRRFRDLAFVALALFGVVVGVGGNLVGSVAGTNIGALRETLGSAARVASWTPMGWAWSLPADVGRAKWSVAGVHLLLALALVAGLWRVWGHFLAARLVEGAEGGGGSHQVSSGVLIDRLFPATPAGGVAARTLRYWRRDPRYLAGFAGFVIGPVVIMVTQLSNPTGSPALAVLGPSLLGLLVGLSVAQDLSYDGTALWLHVSTGLHGVDDRAGRVMSTLVVFVPLTLLLLVAAFGFSGAWSLLAPVAGLTLGLMLIGLGVGSYVGALWQWPAPPPGANPFQKTSSGGLPALLTVTVTLFGTLLLAVPTIVVLIWSFFTPWVGYLTLPVGLICGLVVLRMGVDKGGARLDRRWPEAMAAVSERAG